MESRTASSCPPMTLRERQVLEATQVQFLVPPLPGIFLATATQVLNKALLTTFINNLLFTLRRNSSLAEIPASGCWGLEGDKDRFMDLDNWDPRQTDLNVFKVIALPTVSNPAALNPIYPQWADLGGGSWLQTSRIKSIQLPSEEIFEIQGSHLLVVVHCRVKVKVSNKKSRIDESRNSILIPADLKAVDLVKAFKNNGNVSGLFKMSDLTNNLRTDSRTAMELGWRHGTELRLDML